MYRFGLARLKPLENRYFSPVHLSMLGVVRGAEAQFHVSALSRGRGVILP